MSTRGRWYRSVKVCRMWVASGAACVLVAAGVVIAAPPASAKVCDGTSVPCKIGDTGPGGGIVFYDAGTRQAWGQYLEAVPCLYRDRRRCTTTSWVNKHDPRQQWCKADRIGLAERLPTSSAIGTGRSNTEIIIQACGPNSAAGVAAAYRGGGKDDWFLPSKDELNALYDQRGVVGALANDYYWSSSLDSVSAYNAWHQYFGGGNQNSSHKVNAMRFRPVRAF